MSDCCDIFAEIKIAKQERHSRWKIENTKIVESSGLPFKIVSNGETILFRFPEKQGGEVKCDFYPSTGRFRLNGNIQKGGAKQMLEMLNKLRK